MLSNYYFPGIRFTDHHFGLVVEGPGTLQSRFQDARPVRPLFYPGVDLDSARRNFPAVDNPGYVFVFPEGIVGNEWIAIGIALLVDLAGHGGGYYHRNRIPRYRRS